MLATGASFDADCNNGLENGVSHAAMLAYAPASGMVSATPPAQASVSNRVYIGRRSPNQNPKPTPMSEGQNENVDQNITDSDTAAVPQPKISMTTKLQAPGSAPPIQHTSIDLSSDQQPSKINDFDFWFKSPVRTQNENEPVSPLKPLHSRGPQLAADVQKRDARRKSPISLRSTSATTESEESPPPLQPRKTVAAGKSDSPASLLHVLPKSLAQRSLQIKPSADASLQNDGDTKAEKPSTSTKEPKKSDNGTHMSRGAKTDHVLNSMYKKDVLNVEHTEQRRLRTPTVTTSRKSTSSTYSKAPNPRKHPRSESGPILVESASVYKRVCRQDTPLNPNDIYQYSNPIGSAMAVVDFDENDDQVSKPFANKYAESVISELSDEIRQAEEEEVTAIRELEQTIRLAKTKKMLAQNRAKTVAEITRNRTELELKAIAEEIRAQERERLRIERENAMRELEQQRRALMAEEENRIRHTLTLLRERLEMEMKTRENELLLSKERVRSEVLEEVEVLLRREKAKEQMWEQELAREREAAKRDRERLEWLEMKLRLVESIELERDAKLRVQSHALIDDEERKKIKEAALSKVLATLDPKTDSTENASSSSSTSRISKFLFDALPTDQNDDGNIIISAATVSSPSLPDEATPVATHLMASDDYRNGHDAHGSPHSTTQSQSSSQDARTSGTRTSRGSSRRPSLILPASAIRTVSVYSTVDGVPTCLTPAAINSRLGGTPPASSKSSAKKSSKNEMSVCDEESPSPANLRPQPHSENVIDLESDDANQPDESHPAQLPEEAVSAGDQRAPQDGISVTNEDPDVIPLSHEEQMDAILSHLIRLRSNAYGSELRESNPGVDRSAQTRVLFPQLGLPPYQLHHPTSLHNKEKRIDPSLPLWLQTLSSLAENVESQAARNLPISDH